SMRTRSLNVPGSDSSALQTAKWGSSGAFETASHLRPDRKSTRLNSSHANIYTLSLHDALPILHEDSVLERPGLRLVGVADREVGELGRLRDRLPFAARSEEHTSELQSRQYLHSFPTRRSSDPP